MNEPRPEASVCLFGAEALLPMLDTLLDEREGVRAAEDIEFIHRMRVASRRLRATLDAFTPCLPAKRAATWIKRLRRITRALGAARDADVQVAFLTKFLRDTPTSLGQAGLKRMLLRLAQRRQAVQHDVIDALDKLEAHHGFDDLSAYLRIQIARARLAGAEAHAPATNAFAARAIGARLEAFMAYAPVVSHPERLEELHAMRIVAKQLRYTLQLFAPLFSDGLKAAVQAARAAQDLLGELHDADVWVQFATTFEEKERARTLAYYGHGRTFSRLLPGLIHLRENRLAERDRCYRDFVKAWRAATRAGVWTALRATLDALNVPPAPPVESEQG